MRTTIDISDAVLAELREKASKNRRPFRQVVEETLQLGLAAEPDTAKPVILKTYPVGIKAAYRGVSMNQLYDQLESEDNLRVAES
jgi:hypothetical protein